MVVLDTSVIIDHLRLKSERNSLLKKVVKQYSNVTFCLSVITVQELYQGESSRKVSEERRMETVLELYQLMPYNYEIAKLAGEIVRDNKNLVEFPDAAIAATALVNEAELLTLNKKHFAGIKGLELFDINRLKRILLR